MSSNHKCWRAVATILATHTLFGAGAQAGVIRYITNKPKLNVTEGNFTAGYGVTAGGDPNTNVTAVLNLPLITDTLAVRGVASAGISRDAWTAEFFAQNLTDVIKSTFTSTNQSVVAESITRPRVLGLKVGYKFGP